MLRAKFPETTNQLTVFFDSVEFYDEAMFYISDFLLYSLKKDIFLMDDQEISSLMELG